ncbi:MAG: alpha/beta hydrolase [Nitriliruptorales bacterium]|nr:alpha/beta hydrolase [Nitriliruptorales bacterium]
MLTNDGTSMRQERQRDNQQWMLDWIIKTTGREQNFAYDYRRFPPEAKSYRMIPRVMHREGAHKEALARAADEAGHAETATALYYEAVETYRHGQHVIFEDDNPEKTFLHDRMSACYDRIVALSNGAIERVEIAWEDHLMSGILHRTTGPSPAPLVIFCPGMDMTKEAMPHPANNPWARRGLHILSIDGPGQGVSNLRKVRVTADNYERAATAFVDAMVERPDVDAGKIAVSGFSMGSHWGTRLAALDSRVKAIATAAACYGSKRPLFQFASPRFKQMFMYMAGIHDEDEFDDLAEQMGLLDEAAQIRCPSLQVIGEYDPLCYLEDAYDVYERIQGPKEFWVIENDFHIPVACRNLGGLDIYPFLADWLRDALNGRFADGHRRDVLVQERRGAGPYSDPVPGYWLPERAPLLD